MLIDGRTLSPGTRLRSRVCIVGTGMGALSVAHGLVAAGIDVLFIETGSPAADTRAAPLAIEEVGRPFGLTRSRGLELGGGTGFWHGICAELDEIDFRRRDWIAHSGWPIGAADLAPHYRQAWQFLCGRMPSDMPAALPPLAPPDGLGAKLYRFRAPPFRGKDLVLDWSEQRQARCVTHATALELVVDEVGTAHELIVGSAGRLFRVQADAFVLAAGALETPRLLLNSGAGSGLYWLGRNLIDHPAAYVSQLVFSRPLDVRPFSGIDVGGGLNMLPGYVVAPQLQETHGLANHTVFIRPGPDARKRSNSKLMSFLGLRGMRDLRPAHVAALLTDRHVRWRIAQQRLGLGGRTRYGDLFFMTEQLPNPASRVDLSDRRRDGFGYRLARVNWQLSYEDIERFGRSLALTMDGFARASGVRATRDDTVEDWLGSVSSAAHHLGTMRMASSPALGVVDADQKLFGATNIWVGDGSVFPTAGSVNPSLTICALGHRLAAHLLAGALRPAMLRTVGTVPAAAEGDLAATA